MPSIKDKSTVEKIATVFCNEGKRNKAETMRIVGYQDSYCDNRGTGIVYTNDRVIKAIAKIDRANQAKNEHDLQIAINNLYADYKRLETAANAGNIAAINARTSIMRELDCINGLQKQTITSKIDPITAIDPELQARLDIVARDYKERKAKTG